MSSHEPANVTLRRRNILRFIATIVLAAVLVGVLWQGLLFYHHQRQRDWLRRGRAAYERGDFNTASVWIARLLQTNAHGVEVCRLIADMADVGNSPEAMLWRIRVVQLEPGNPDNLLSWAKTALRLRDLELADRALKLVPQNARDSAAFHSLRAAWAMNSGNAALADFHFNEAARLDPS